MLTVKIVLNDKGNPPGKLADAELHFTMPDPATFPASLRPTFEALAGLKLIGFGVWERRRDLSPSVTFPARTYAVNGERRSFALLRPIQDTLAQDRLRNLIVEAYRAAEATAPAQTE